MVDNGSKNTQQELRNRYCGRGILFAEAGAEEV